MSKPLQAELEDYRRLIEIAAELSSQLDLSTLLIRITEAARDITDSEAASILLYDENTRELYFQTATNIDEPTMRGLVVPLEGSIAGWVLRNQQPVRVDDTRTDPRYYGEVAQIVSYDTRSLLAVPMRTKNRIVGVLEVLNKKEGHFTDSDEHLLTVLAGQAAIAIENSRLFQQFDLISEFVHELRTPLASLSTATYLLMRPEISPEQRDEIVRNLHEETLRLSQLASTFLDLSRLESGRVQFEMQKIDVAELLQSVVTLMQARASERNIQLRLELPDDLPPLWADPNRLKQVIINLVSNAIKYNYPNGQVIVRAAVQDDEFVIAVEDTGLGIPPDAMPHLFEKFYRVRALEDHAQGTGLGLAITRQIVEAHGGRIEVTSQVGQGSTFTVYLPREPKN